MRIVEPADTGASNAALTPGICEIRPSSAAVSAPSPPFPQLSLSLGVRQPPFVAPWTRLPAGRAMQVGTVIERFA